VGLMSELRRIYRCVDEAVAALGGRCLGGGACCKFDLVRHRLYLSTGELALLTVEPPPKPQRALTRRCPYQLGPRCLARARRPLGCRTFFCEKTLEGLSRQWYETFHGEIRRLHETHCLPYGYADLGASLVQLFIKT
ncbi:MAG: hypothetical protein KAU28_01305, partial [Phycisphaerae bacterium]|nr:hypothetical protein [Phycisphaerae bacterium]